MKELTKILGELAGYASLCWKPKPKGVFNSTLASKEVDQAETQILALMTPSVDDIVKIMAEVEENTKGHYDDVDLATAIVEKWGEIWLNI
jgi:hypothetical protein